MSLSFNWAQIVFIDETAVKNATEVAVTRIDLFFRAKPPAEGNKSGISNPGVEVMLLPCKDGLPVVSQIGAYRPTEPTEHGAKFAFYSGGQSSRREWDEITPSVDASVPTSFLLPSPALVRTNQEYAIVVKFDGNENFVLWESVSGENLVGTSTVSYGPSNRYTGPLYEAINSPTSSENYGLQQQGSADSPSIIHTTEQGYAGAGSNSYLSNNWAPVPNTCLKYKLYVAKYSHSGQPLSSNVALVPENTETSAVDHVGYISGLNSNTIVSNNVIRLFSPTECQEYIKFDKSNSIRNEIFYGEPIFQHSPEYPGGQENPLKIVCAPASISIPAGIERSNLIIANGAHIMPSGNTFANDGGFDNVVEWIGLPIVIKTEDGNYEFRHIAEVVNSTSFIVDIPFDEMYTNATFMISPVAFVNDISPAFIQGKSLDILTLYDSFVTDGLRFVSKQIEGISVLEGGSGYSNTDYIKVSGYEHVANVVEGNYPAYANIVTDSSGTITNVYISNCGAGFINPEALVGANVEILTSENGIPSNSASQGTGALLDFDVGTSLYSTFTTTKFADCEVIDLDAVRMKPEITVNNPVGTAFTIKHRTNFYRTRNANTSSGFATFMNTPEEAVKTDTYAKIFKNHTLLTNSNRVPVIPSRSNQMVIRYANGHIPSFEDIGDVVSNSAVYVFEISSNNDYQAVFFDPEIVNAHYGHYVINREYSEEHTNHGAAWAKHLAKKISFNEDRFAENLFVYLTAYKPQNTEFKVYAKLHNSHDNEEFDDKDWTLLRQTSGVGMVSSAADSSDYIELEYQLPLYPNSEFTLNGSVTINQGNSIVTGSGTTFTPTVFVSSGGINYVNGEVVTFNPPPDVIPGSGPYAIDTKYVAKGTLTTNSSGGITSVSVSNTGKGWLNQSNVISFDIQTANGSGAELSYRPGLVENDVVKIYSPFFSDTNYVLAVVNNVIDNTTLQIKRTLGDLSSNGVGTVSVNTTSVAITGSGTDFTSDFSEGDFIAVWANSSVYEVRRINEITNSAYMEIDTGNNFTFASASLNYAYVEANTFNNTSITVSGLNIDRIHYPHQVYIDTMNKNVCKYYNNELSMFNTFDTFQIKVVMLGESSIEVPKILNIRGVGTSA